MTLTVDVQNECTLVQCQTLREVRYHNFEALKLYWCLGNCYALRFLGFCGFLWGCPRNGGTCINNCKRGPGLESAWSTKVRSGPPRCHSQITASRTCGLWVRPLRFTPAEWTIRGCQKTTSPACPQISTGLMLDTISCMASGVAAS